MSSLWEQYQNKPIPVVFEQDSTLKGTLRLSQSARFAGSFEGSIESVEFMLMEKTSAVKATVTGNDIVVAGEIRGDIHASGMVELLPGSRMYGNIRSSRIRVCEGAIFEGRCDMIRNAQNLDVFSAPIKEMRKAIHVADEEQ